MSKQHFLYWMAIEDGTLLKFSELAHRMARAMHPDDRESHAYGATRVNLDDELPQAVQRGELVVRNPAGLGRHTFPHGDALLRAVMMPQDIRPFLATRGIELRLTPAGSGPVYWTLENAAAAIAEQEGWHNGARGALLDSMMEAAQRGLTVREPLTDLPKTSGRVREFWETVTRADVNAWLEKQEAPYRWDAKPMSDHAGWLSETEMSDEARKDPAYQAAYAHAKKLHEEIEKWEQMDSRNIPSEAKLKEETLRSLRHALASVDESFARGGEPQADPVSEQMLLGTKDIKDERGCRRLIREHWANIKALHGPDADGRQVRRVLSRSLSLGDKCHSLKTIQNCLINLRRENLIP